MSETVTALHELSRIAGPRPDTDEMAVITGMMDDLYKNARVLAQNANGVEDPSADDVEKAWYVLATELLKRDDTREKFSRALLLAATEDVA